MKPDFALSLSFEGIALLHRAGNGWRSVGDVALDAADLSADLAALRDRALVLEPGGVDCKLIIPNDQIRYITLDTGSFEGDARHEMVRTALIGATPYPVEDLAFDYAVSGGETQVAAVARQTLDEAEAFAVDHGFNPVSFVAIPGDNKFDGEPFFGSARRLADLRGDRVEPDDIPVEVIDPESVPLVELEPEATADVAIPETVEAPQLETAGAGPSGSDTEVETEARTIPQPIDAEQIDPEALESQPVESEPADLEPVARTAGFSSRRAPDSTHAPALGGASRDHPAAAAPGSEQSESVAETAPEAVEAVSVIAPTLDIPDVAEDAPIEAAPDEPKATRGFLSRRKRRAKPAPAKAAAPAPPQAIAAAPPLPAPTNLARNLTPDDEMSRMTVFGARQPADVGGKPRFLALILTAALLIFLAAVAAWAAVFVDREVVWRFFTGSGETEIATRQEPAEADAPEAPVVQTAQPRPPTPDLQIEAPNQIASPAPAAAPADVQPETAPLPHAPVALAPIAPDAQQALTDTDSAVLLALRDEQVQTQAETEAQAQPETDPEAEADAETAAEVDADDGAEAATRYAATGIWQHAPEALPTPPVIGIDDLYLTSIDRTDLAQDAVALPPAPGFDTDTAPAAVNSPTAPGTAFALDQRGLVRPSEDGTVNPEGVVVYLGKPSTVPPPTPSRAEPEPEAEVIDTRLAGIRPRPRPADLAETTERGQLGGRTRAELGGKRPKLRPENAKVAAERDETPTAQAIVVSRLPKPRPDGFERIVQAAVRAPAPKPETGAATEQAAAVRVAPVTVAPKLPSSASVARQATLENAINLRQVNLIGVYGTPSNRRALVRLPSGRYKKVKVGDTVDGGRILAIGDSSLQYQKSGRNMTLRIPSG